MNDYNNVMVEVNEENKISLFGLDKEILEVNLVRKKIIIEKYMLTIKTNINSFN